MNLDALLQPKSVAVYGASRHPQKIGHAVLSNLISGGFSGRIIPVNPQADSVMGVSCRPSLAAANEQVELAVVALPAPLVAAAVGDALSAGARAVIVVSAGFGECGEEGARRERQLVEMCRQAGAILLGPKSLGVINTAHALNASFARIMPPKGGLSVVSESGALCTAFLSWAAARQLGVAKMIAIGSKAGLNEIETLNFLAEDPQTNLVIGYLESMTSGDTFLRAAERLSRRKPLVLLHGGVTSAGMQAARAHTGRYPGTDIAWSAAFRRSGVIEADSPEMLVDCAAALALQPLPGGTRVAAVSNGGGGAVLTSDALVLAGLELARLSAETVEKLRGELPPYASAENPVDLLGDPDPQRYARVVELLQADPQVDAVLAVLSLHAMTRPVETAEALARSFHRGKTTLLVLLGAADVLPGREQFARVGLPDLNSPRRAAQVLAAMSRLRAWRERPPRMVTRFPVNRRRVERLIGRQRRLGVRQVGEVWAKEILQAYGFRVPGGQLVLEADKAVEAAESLGYPVAVKVVSPDVVHKSDVGGVKLSISDPEQLRDAFDLLALRIQRHAPGARLEGWYIERMSPRGLEVVLGMRRDAQFGPVLLFGLGGIFVEELSDLAAGLAPITADEARQMLMATRSCQMLLKSKAGGELDLEELVEALQRLSQLATDLPQVEELEINPYMLFPRGAPAMVVDARMLLRED
jgi:acyl-CoA synthetase (NDP forming)